MFQWHMKAKVCYVYLPDVSSDDEETMSLRTSSGAPSEWVSRGWCLQELIVPRNMTFFSADWSTLGSKASLAVVIERITGIASSYLRGTEDSRTASIATHLSWQARRETTQIEDLAYSLIGLFDVSVVPMYGEGMQAFMRLQSELLSTSPDESLFT